MEQNMTYSGFKIKNISKIKELDAVMYIMKHEKSGAKLCYLDYDDRNMVFSIGFNTAPKNDTGVFHILEHSVLNGSEKFPLKEPFVDLLKGSMQTYLNAITFSDKTMYPLASQNEKDFMNLMDVYMDAVFHPLIYKKKEIFMQEGWHSVWSEAQKSVIKTGVVYNEMKGAFSDPTRLLMQEVYKTLFPDTSYRFASGGKPESITDLTYEQFIDTHKKYYHPGNCYIFLGGKMNIEDKLKFLDEKYLSSFDKKKRIPFIPIQKPIGVNNNSVIEYKDMSQNSEKDNCYFALNYAIDKANNIKLGLAVQVLKYILFDCRIAPIRKRLLEQNLAKDVSVMYDDSIKQPVFSIMALHTTEKDKQKFLDCVKQGFIDIVNNGIDKDLVESAISSMEFQMRENEYNGYPKGLMYDFQIMKLWLHGWSPVKALQYDKELAAIKEKAKNGYFEQLVQSLFLDSNHSSFIVLKPSEVGEGIAEQKKEVLEGKEKELLIKENEHLVRWQNEKDTDDAIKKLPELTLKDISDKIEHIPTDISYIGNTPVLYHNLKTKEISYLKCYFNLANIAGDKLSYMRLLIELLGNVATKKYNKEQLLSKRGRLFGDLSFYIQIFQNEKGVMPALVVSMKTLDTNLKEALELLEEILYESSYSDLKDIEQTLWTIVSQSEIGFSQYGDAAAARRVRAHYSIKGAYEEYVYGVEGYRFLKHIAKNFQNCAEELSSILNQLSKQILCRENMTFSYTGNEKGYKAFSNFNKEFINVQHIEFMPVKADISMINYNKEAFFTSGQVQYVGLGGNYKKEGITYSGKMQVLGKILSLSYLWNQVRVKGGAYGCWFNISRDGNCIFASFRDPNLTQTLESYKKAEEFIKNFKASKSEMEKFIIGAISDVDKPKSKEMYGFVADKMYFEGVTENMLQNERKNILSATAEDIRGFSYVLNMILRQNQICIIGNKEMIEKSQSSFENISSLMD